MLDKIENLAYREGAKVSRRASIWCGEVVRVDFGKNLRDLEDFMMKIIGNPIASGISSKAIGGVILFWERQK